MDHAEAVRAKAAEGYLLGELSDAERRAFEEHFFTCQECSTDLEEGARFADACREQPTKQPSVRPLGLIPALPARRFRSIYALAASVLFAAVLLYQNAVTIPRLRQSATPQALESFSLESTGSRGAGAAAFAAPKDRPFVILFDIPPGTAPGDYRCEVVSDAGSPMASFQVSAKAAQRTVPVLIPASQLQPGAYSLIVSSADPANMPDGSPARYPFEIR